MQNFYLGYFPFMKFLEEVGIPYILPQEKEPTGNKCKGMAVCFSGVRDKELEEAIVSEGGTIASGVTRRTTHLVAKAKVIGVLVISIDEFRQML